MKVGAMHLRDFGHEKAKGDFYSLIDRLHACSLINHPDRQWSNDTYYAIAFEWIGKDEELRTRVLEVEGRTPLTTV